MSEKLTLYNAIRAVPDEAKKQITGGRLKGMTDVNPMWRIKMLTEQFGACGIGWYTEVIDQRTTEGANGELMCFVDINLYYKDPESGDWSKPIFGTGGSTLIANERSGLFANDEGWKMAYTDALSIACKALGMAADVYYKDDRTKYTSAPKDDSKGVGEAQTQQQNHATPEQLRQINELYPQERIAAMLKYYKVPDTQMLTTEQADYIIRKRQTEIERAKNANG